MKQGGQCDRVLRLARARGSHGIDASDFNGMTPTADGGKAITRLAARIDDLERLGYQFDATKFRKGLKVYVLRYEPNTPAVGEDPETGGALFEMAPPSKSAIFDDAA